ncbi:MAG: archease [Deltaproteobacteria bacterium]|nr:archease [Deltaproteobacteria bacterium]
MKAVSYRYIEHTADLGFEAWGRGLEAMFTHAAEALMGVMVDPETVEPAGKRTIKAQASGLESLLVSWLNELLYVFDTEQWVFTRFDGRTSPGGNRCG